MKDSSKVTPFAGPGQWVREGIDFRMRKIWECLRHGPPVYEFTKPRGYDEHRYRCSRCKSLKQHHEAAAAKLNALDAMSTSS